MRVDCLIRGGQVFNVYRKKYIPQDVAVLGGRFLFLGDAAAAGLEPDEVVDATGKWMIPGLIDIHLHVESSMVTPAAFAQGLARCGVTTVVAEPHEIANVRGVGGVLAMIRAAEGCEEADIFYGVPSCVPSTDLETTGGRIGVAEADELLRQPRVKCLGEVMSYSDLLGRPDSRIHRLLEFVRREYPELVLEGHFPRRTGLDLARYLYAGVDSDHTEQTPARMAERLDAGMFLEIQEKSVTPDNMEYLRREGIPGRYALVTDDVMADTFVRQGHLNFVLQRAVACGLPAEEAVYAATFSPAARMKLRDRGAIAPGRLADFVLLNDPAAFEPAAVYKAGRNVYAKGEAEPPAPPEGQFPADFYHSVRREPPRADDFRPEAPAGANRVLCRVMKVSPDTTFTAEARECLPCRGGRLDWEDSSLCLAAVFNRYSGRGAAYGLVGGTLREGALATTYAHDHHNLLVVGRSPADMAAAAGRVIGQGGGICAFAGGKELANVPLPVGGILSEKPLAEVGAQVARLKTAMETLGYRHHNPIMSLCTLSLPVSPALKLTDRGLVDVENQKIVPLFVEG